MADLRSMKVARLLAILVVYAATGYARTCTTTLLEGMDNYGNPTGTSAKSKSMFLELTCVSIM